MTTSHSNTEFINEALVHQLIVSQFPHWANLPIRAIIPGGWDNRTFRLGEHMIMRLPSSERYANQVKKEQVWLPKLSPHLPHVIPRPLAMGKPIPEYPWNWSVYQWIEGESAATATIKDKTAFAASLAQFLKALQKIDASDAPPAGADNFYRGGAL